MPTVALRVVQVHPKCTLHSVPHEVPYEEALPTEGTHQREMTAICLHPELKFATDRNNRWHVQIRTQDRGVSLNGVPLGFGHSSYRLKAGDEIVVRWHRDVFHGDDDDPSLVELRAVVVEYAAAVNTPSGPALNEALGADELYQLVNQIGHSASMYALAATCRACRTAVQRTTAAPAWIDAAQRQRSLWQLVGEGWPLSVLNAKLSIAPAECEAQLREMLTVSSMRRMCGFPFASHITKGWALVPAGTLLERCSADKLASLCARVPAAAQRLTETEDNLKNAAKHNYYGAQWANVMVFGETWHSSGGGVASFTDRQADMEKKLLRDVQHVKELMSQKFVEFFHPTEPRPRSR